MAHKIFVFCPAFGGNFRSETVRTLLGIQATFMGKGMLMSYYDFSFPDVAEARAIATTLWYDRMPDFEHMLWIDSDMGFDPQMILDMFLLDEPIVGAVYPQRKVPVGWAGSGIETPTTERRGDFIVMEGVGFGATLMRRDAITKMLEAYPELIDTRLALHPAKAMMDQLQCNRMLRLFEKLDIPDRGILSEDLSFCRRWSNLGGKVWASVGYRISHVGPYDYAARYLDQFEALANQQAQMEAALRAQGQPQGIPMTIPVAMPGAAMLDEARVQEEMRTLLLAAGEDPSASAAIPIPPQAEAAE